LAAVVESFFVKDVAVTMITDLGHSDLRCGCRLTHSLRKGPPQRAVAMKRC
jgi:hypothetical protein